MIRNVLLTTLVLAALWVSPLAQADYFPALGAPADRKVDLHFNRYHDYAALHDGLDRLNAAFPDITRLYSIGQSHEGRELWCLEVTNFAEGDAVRKTGMYIGGNIHGNEVQAGEIVLYTAWYLCENYGIVDEITELVNDRVFYLVPTINPDGRDYWFHEVQNQHSSRSGKKPLDNDRDGLFDEDDYDDLDGDGSITSMRIKDPNGRYKPHPEYPQYFMVRCEDDEPGQYSLLGREGFDNDGDGRVNEDTAGGYDSNRNWAGPGWRPPYVQYGAHDYPFSLPNTRAVAEFELAHPNIAAGQAYHNNGGMILRGPGYEGGPMHRDDERVMRFIGERGERQLPEYESMISWSGLYSTYGDETAWLYARGILAYTNELWNAWNWERSDPSGGRDSNDRDLHAIKYLLLNEGITPWAAYDHPDFGEVEIGGIKKNFGRVPPSFLLEEECHRNMMFTLYHAKQMPRLHFGDVTVERLDDGLYKLWVEVRNDRLMGSRTGFDVQNSISPPDVITVAGDNATVIAAGHVRDQFFKRVDPVEARPERLTFDRVPGMDSIRAQFIVEGTGNVTITVDSTKGGVLTREVTLE